MTANTEASQAIHLLAAINRLSLKAFNAKTQQSLTFLILNDTLKIVKYHRAGLWKIENKEAKLVGISGYSTFSDQTPFIIKWGEVVSKIEDPKKIQSITLEAVIPEDDQPANMSMEPPQVLWMPIVAHGNVCMGLWLERGHFQPWKDDEIEILNFLMQSYKAAWEKFSKMNFIKFKVNKSVLYISAAAVLLLMLIHIPLPISAPCEVVPQHPIPVTAPLDGIIDHVTVMPGQTVKKGDLLFIYDKRVPQQELDVAKDQVRIIESELKRASSLAFKDKKALEQVGVAKEKLKKERAVVSLAQYKVEQLEVKSPIDGIVILENPDQWRGNPVHLGESVMTISDSSQTKVKIWIPENDNVNINMKKEVKVVLNVMPETSFYAKLLYIGDYTTESEKTVPSFIAEAEWDIPPSDIRPGLKGTAILYGENVSLVYWIVRRPWAYLRNLFGM